LVLCAPEQAAEEKAVSWKRIWSDEFEGKEIDRSRWDFDLGNGFFNYDGNTWIGGWGNDELQYYTREPDNVFVKEGMLHIRAVKESIHGCGYTSARLKSRKRDGSPLFQHKYGKFEFRAKLPLGKGLWPALWMLPEDEKYGGWAASGEIDVMEARGQEPNKVLGTLHFGSNWPANTHISKDYRLPREGTIADFHVYALEWEPGEMRWYVDDRRYATQSFWWSSSKSDGKQGVKPASEAELNPWPAPFDRPFYLLINLAVGGKFLGNPDKTTVFPAEMLVDYVRVYDKVGGYGETKPRGKGALPFANRN
jgi:beta-glucanase (GH16 family)